MKAPVAAVLVVALAALSGCIGFAPSRDAPVAAAPPSDWVPLFFPAETPAVPVLQFWVPAEATGLRVHWLPVAVEWDETPFKSGHAGPNALFGTAAPGLRLFAPDGTPLDLEHTGRPIVPDATATSWNATLDIRTFESPSPQPGAYLLVLYGSVPPPWVEVHVPRLTPVAPIAPAPFAFQRILLHEGGLGAGAMTAEGEIPLPAGTVMAYGDLLGAGLGAHLELSTERGTAATTSAGILATPAGWRGLTLGIDLPTRIMRSDDVHPDALVGPTLRYALSGTGTATAFALLGNAGTSPAPHAVPFVEARGVDAEETIGLAGGIPAGDAKWFVAPAGARLLVAKEGPDDPASHVRIYDLGGRRIQWGDIGEPGRIFAVPAGPLVVVNDGPAALNLALLDAAPTDATLHEVATRTIDEAQTLDALQGHDVHTTRIQLPGPVLHWTVSTAAYLADLQSTLLLDDRALASAPDLNELYPGESPCCSLPFFGYAAGDTHWLDGGTYALRTDATAGQGEALHTFRVLDLDGIAGDVQAVQAQQAEPQL